MRATLVGALCVLTALSATACTNQVVRADEARVVVDTSPAAPLALIIATDFQVIPGDGDGGGNAVLSVADTVSLTGDFDRTYQLDDDAPRIYVRLINTTEANETARLRIFLDDEREYDAEATMAPGAYLQYTYHASDLWDSSGL